MNFWIFALSLYDQIIIKLFMWRCNIVINAHKKQKWLRFRNLCFHRNSNHERASCDLYDVFIEILMQINSVCSQKTKNLIEIILRSCRIEFSDERFDLKIKWINRKWRWKLLLNVNVSWQKRQIWKKFK